jgi:DNA invertase Pin-like site-specific DNA recombinase
MGGTKTVKLCEACHGILHSISPHINELRRRGIAKAKAEGRMGPGKSQRGLLRKVTKEQVEEMRTMRDAGCLRRDIAKLFGLSEPHVWRLLASKPGEKLIYRTGTGYPKIPEQKKQEIRRLKAEGLSNPEVARRLGLNRVYVWEFCKRLKLTATI